MPISFSGYDPYKTFYMTASNGIVEGSECVDIVNVVYCTCSLSLTPAGEEIQSVLPGANVPISSWFNLHPLQEVNYIVESPPDTIITLDGFPYVSGDVVYHTFPNEITTATVTVSDPRLGGFCSLTKTLNVNSCGLIGYRGRLTYTTSTSTQQLPMLDTSIGPPPNPPFIGWPPNTLSLGLNRYFIGASTAYTAFAVTLNPEDLESEIDFVSFDPINPGYEYWNYFLPANHNSPWIRVQAFNSSTCTAVVNIYNSSYDTTPEEEEANNTNTGPPKPYACCDIDTGQQVGFGNCGGDTYPCIPQPGNP